MSVSRHDITGRLDDLVRLYVILDTLERKVGGRRLLSECIAKMDWPQRGVYFFMEEGEHRTDSGSGLRVVRVGTHALTASSRTTLWKRLSQHKGQAKSGGGNHRGSIFRLLVGSTLANSNGAHCATWGIKSNATTGVRASEETIEREVSRTIRAMPFLWLAADDTPGPQSIRGYVERNSISLLSNLGKPPLDPASAAWRGHACHRGEGLVKDSGLWNQNHVREAYDPAFLDVLDALVSGVEART